MDAPRVEAAVEVEGARLEPALEVDVPRVEAALEVEGARLEVEVEMIHQPERSCERETE